VTGRRVPWWGWLLVAAPWAAGLGWAVVVAIIGPADREVVVRGPATVGAIVAGSVLTAVAAALVVTFRQPWPGTDHLGRPALPDPQEGPVHGSPSLLHRLDREAVGRLGSVRDLLASVRAAAERGVIAPADVTGERARADLAKAAVERHGGTIRVRSREGLGTVVAVALPAARRPR